MAKRKTLTSMNSMLFIEIVVPLDLVGWAVRHPFILWVLGLSGKNWNLSGSSVSLIISIAANIMKRKRGGTILLAC